MKLRTAQNVDAPAIKELVFGVLASYGLKPDPASTDKDLDDIEKNYLENVGYFAVLEHEGTIVGSYGLFRVNESECELRKMYLSPGFRRKGLGKLLLEHALEKAKELKYDVVNLETASVLKEAIALYRKYGFVPYKAEHLSARCDQAYRKEIETSKKNTIASPCRCRIWNTRKEIMKIGQVGFWLALTPWIVYLCVILALTARIPGFG